MKKFMLIMTLICGLLMTGCSLQQEDIARLIVTTPDSTEVPVATAAPEVIAVPAATEIPAETEAAELPQAFLVVTVGNAIYEPIPLKESGRYTIRRGDFVNTIEVTPDSIRMAESSCDNQDCVEQGLVSLENRSSRVLQNMIICLPNEVVLELYTYDEVLQQLPGWLGVEAE